MMKINLLEGDVVRVKCGGPAMVVELVAEHVDPPFARCIWFDQRRLLRRTSIRLLALERAQPAKPTEAPPP